MDLGDKQVAVDVDSKVTLAAIDRPTDNAPRRIDRPIRDQRAVKTSFRAVDHLIGRHEKNRANLA